jgi:hypothetical protein
LVKSRLARLNVISRRKIVKKFFLVLLVLLVGITGLSAAPPGVGGGDNTLQMIIPQADIAVSIAAPVMPAPMRPDEVFVTAQGNEAAFTQDLELICLWAEQYREGLLTQDEFKPLVAGRIAVIRIWEQADYGGMRAPAEKTREKTDRFFFLRERKLGIRRIGSLTPAQFPLLC